MTKAVKPTKKTSSSLASVAASALANAQLKFGIERVYVGAEHEIRQAGIPIPSLALRWLIDSNVWPIQRITQSAGAFGSCKSSFIFQLEKWFLESEGGAIVIHIDTENKTSASLMQSIIPERFFQDNREYYQVFQVNSINQWQRGISEYVKYVEAAVKENSGKKPSWSMLICVDSMTGAGSEESMENIQKEGDAKGRGFSDASILIAQYLRDLSGRLLGLPVTVHMSNHEKDNLNTPGQRRPGGSAPDFHATLDLRFQKGARKDGYANKTAYIKKANLEGKIISISVRKSSMGTDIQKSIIVPFLWKFDENGRQVSWWDWHSACSYMLKENASQLKDVIDINVTGGDNGNKFFSERLGMKEKEHLPPDEFGSLVEGNIEVVTAIEKALHLQQHQVYKEGVFDFKS